MKDTSSMKPRNLRRSVLVAALFWISPASAFWGVGDVVTDPGLTMKMVAAEAARAGQTATMIQNQLNQYVQMIRNGLSLADPVFKPLGDTLRMVNSVYMQGQGLMYTAQNMDSMFGSMYPSYYSYLATMGQGRSMSETMPTLYKQWSDRGYENTRKAMLSAGMQVDGMKSEQEMLERLTLQANTARGQTQTIHAAAQIAANQAEQMQNLRLLIAQQTNLHANYMAQEVEQQSARNAATMKYKEPPVTNSPGMDF